MAKTLGMDVSTAPDDLIDTSQNISPEDISRKQQEINMFGKAMILLEGDMFVIRFPYDRAIIDAIKTKMIRIKPEWDNDRKAWKTKDLDTALEIFQFFKDYRPDWELDTTAIDKAVVDRDTRNAELRKPIPEVEAELDPKFKLFPYQNEGVRFLNKTNGNALIGDEMGLGKFQSVDSKLLTPNGFIRMGDVKIGDEVFGSDGLPHKVTAIFPQGLKDCYEIEFTDGSKTTSGDEHLWSVRTALQKWRNSPHKTMQLQEFKDKLHDKDGNTEYFIPMVCPLKFEKKELAVDPYVLGALIGDGSLSQHTVGFTSTDRFMADEIQSLSDNKFVVNDLSHKYAWSLTNTNKNEFSLKNEIKKMNLDVLSYYKHIPNDYKFSSIDQRTSLLQGLMDTDGGVDTKDGIVITYSSTSEQLINDVQFIVESLGGTARKTTRVTKFTYKGIKKDGRRSWRINISLPTDIKPFRLPRKLEVYKPRSKYKPYRGFKSVTHIGKIECQCITVDSTDHLYATDHCILTHNTLQTLAWCASNNKRALVVCPKNMRLTWIEEAMKFFPNYYSGKTAELKADELRKGKIPNLQNVNLASVNYQSVGKFEGPISQAGFDVIVMDESHRVKDPKAQQTQKLLQLSQLFPHHILLSGTAIKNKKEELATQLAIIAPQMGVTAAQLRRMSYGQLRNLIHDVYIQRQKSTVLKDLPPKTQKNLNVEMPNLPQMPRFIAPGAGSSTYTVQDVDGNTYELNREYVAKYKKKMADAKAVHTAEFVQNILDDTDENVLVFSESVQATKEIANILGPIALLHYGSMRDDDRERVKKDFMDPQKPYRVLVSTTASLKEGATLTKASTVVFNDVAWTAADMAQAEARTHRPGQKKNVSVYWMTAAGHPWDEKLNAILRKKYLIHKQVNLGENLSPEEKEFLNTKIPGEEELEKIISLGGKRPKKDTENQGPEEPYELDDETVIKSSYRHRILSKTGFRI